MDNLYYYLLLSGVLTVLLWVTYILARVFVWGLPTFLNNYPEGYPEKQPQPPLWAQRAHRAHLNMVETLPAFIAVVIAASQLATELELVNIATWAQIFFYSRVVYSLVYLLGIPFLRTPTYLVSWLSILVIAFQIL